MIVIKKIESRQLHGLGLDDRVIAFDRENMGPILAARGMPFPEDVRRKGFEADGTFHLAFDHGERIIGYLQYAPDWNDADAIYISSLQIPPAYRNSKLFLRLLASAIADLKHRSFTRLVTGVQKHNTIAISIYRRLGFTVCEEKASQTSYPVYADRSILETELAKRLLDMASQPRPADAGDDAADT